MTQLAFVASSASSTSGSQTSALAIDRYVSASSFWWATGYAPQSLTGDLGSGNAAAVAWYSVSPYPNDVSPPSAWTFEGSNDNFATAGVVLDTRSSITYPNGSEVRTFSFANTTAYRYYRLNVSAPTSGGGSGIAVADLRVGTGVPDSALYGLRGNASQLSGSFTIGVVFVPQVDGFITHIWGYKYSSISTATFGIYDTANTSLITPINEDQSLFPANQWFSIPLPSPLAVTAGVPLMVTGYYPTNSGYLAGGISSDLVHGDIKIPANGSVTFSGSTQNIRYASGNAYPTSNASDTHLLGVQLSSPPQALPYADTFTRSDSASVLGTTTTGHAPWTATSGAWGITSGKAYLSSAPAAQISFATVDAGVADVVMSTVITGSSYNGLCFRVTDANNLYAVEVTPGSSYGPVIFKRVAGSNSTVATGSAVTFASGDTLSVELSGSSITVKRNGTTIVSGTDSTFLTQTKHGLYSHSTAGSAGSGRFDSFAIASAGGGNVSLTSPAAAATAAAAPATLSYTALGLTSPAAAATAAAAPATLAFAALPLVSPAASATAAAAPGTLSYGNVSLDSPAASATAAAAPATVSIGGLDIESPPAGATAGAEPGVLEVGALSLTSPEASATAAAAPATLGIGSALSLPSPPASAVADAVPATLSGFLPIVTDVIQINGGIQQVTPLVAAPISPGTMPIMRVSHIMPELDADHPSYVARVDYPIIREIIGYPQLWINGFNCTDWRGQPTIIRRWETEVPICDTAAAFEFPQIEPWEAHGEGELEFLRGDPEVIIGLVDEDGVVHRDWEGFFDARGNAIVGMDEDRPWEAKGSLWAAMHDIHEPFAILEPMDVGVLIARVMNSVETRRYADFPETPIGITTRNRGTRNDKKLEYVRQILSESYTSDGRQATIARVAPDVFRVKLKPAMSTVHHTVAFGTDGVDIDLRVDESTRVDGVYADAIAPNDGGWANVFYPALELLTPPPYPNDDPTEYLNFGVSDGDTDSGTGVTDWQERVVEIHAFNTPAVSGTMSAAWVGVVDDLQRYLGITVDNSVGPQTWNATFDRGGEGLDMTPLRLPIAVKNTTMKYLYSASGVKLGPNPTYDPDTIKRFIAVNLGPQKTKKEGRVIGRSLIAQFGEAGAFGQIRWENDPNNGPRTDITTLSNIKVTGWEGGDRILQVSHKTVELEESDDGPLWVVTTDVDQHARDAMAVEDLLAQQLSVNTLNKRPNPLLSRSKTADDQRIPWDSESPCGVLRRTAVNGSSGLWTGVTIPFAEIGKLASIELQSTQPFACFLVSSLRLTENRVASIVGNPFSKDDPFRTIADDLAKYGFIAAWGQQGDACGYSPGTESDDYPFTGRFEHYSPVDYWTETPPYVQFFVYMRGGSGYIKGRFRPAFE